jgi:hypothetical protein
MKSKRGIIREDGRIFWSYSKRNGKIIEYWTTEEQYKKLTTKEKNRSKERYKKNPESNLESCKRWYQKNKKHKLNKCKEYRQENRELYRNNIKKRRNENPLYRCSSGIRSLIIGCMRNGGFKKTTKTSDILGCSFEEFKAHIESQFLPRMSWDNRSEWHIDHIMPVSMANTYDEVVRLNHYKNLRPMWASDNIRKSDKIGDTLVLF